jgi:hypothetical protein
MVELNFTVEAILNFFACFPVAIAIGFLGAHFRRSKNRQILLMLVGWSSLFLYLFTEGLSYIIESKYLYQLHGLFMVPLGFAVLLWVDYLNQDQISPYKITLFAFLVGIIGVFLFRTDMVYSYYYPNGDLSFGIAGNYIYWVIALSTYPGMFWWYYAGRVYQYSPQYLKTYALLFFIGASMITALQLILVGFRLTLIFPGIDAVVTGIGALLTSLTFIRKPQLGYILPFKVQKLAVLSSQSNLILFLHKWITSNTNDEKAIEKLDLDDARFSGMLSGIHLLIKETVQRGEVKEITTDNAVMLINHHPEHPILFVLLVSKATKSLRTAFNTFVRRFVTEYGRFFYGQYDKSNFTSAIRLIESCFPFVPYRALDDSPTFMIKKPQKNCNEPDMGQPNCANDNLPLPQTNPDIADAIKICASCRDIKDLHGHWNKMVNFVRALSGGETAWEICPKCYAQKHFIQLSFFHDTFGPQILFYTPQSNFIESFKQIPALIQMNYQDVFVSTIDQNTVLNLPFSIKSDKARGREYLLLLSYCNIGDQTNEKFGSRFLHEIAGSLQTLNNLDVVLAAKNAKERLKSPGFEEVKTIIEQYYHIIPEKIIQYYLLDMN